MGSVVAFSAEGPHYWPPTADAPVLLKDLGKEGIAALLADLREKGYDDTAAEVEQAASYIVWEAKSKLATVELTMDEIASLYEAVEAWLILPKDEQPDWCDQHLVSAQGKLGPHYLG